MTDLDDKIAGVEIPDTALVRDATDLVRSVTDDLLFDHSRRVYLWGMLHSRRRGLAPDPELLYVEAAVLHPAVVNHVEHSGALLQFSADLDPKSE